LLLVWDGQDDVKKKYRFLPVVGLNSRDIIDMNVVVGRSQCPSGLWRELSSLSRTLGSWVRIALKAWMSVSVYSVFVLSCV
jgi:hypothetical protein